MGAGAVRQSDSQICGQRQSDRLKSKSPKTVLRYYLAKYVQYLPVPRNLPVPGSCGTSTGTGTAQNHKIVLVPVPVPLIIPKLVLEIKYLEAF